MCLSCDKIFTGKAESDFYTITGWHNKTPLSKDQHFDILHKEKLLLKMILTSLVPREKILIMRFSIRSSAICATSFARSRIAGFI